MPDQHIAAQLIQPFFNKIHPAYPVFDRERFSRLYLNGQMSPLVLQAIFLLGFTVGTDELAHASGFRDRATARKTCYLRAKALYDADYESDHITLWPSCCFLDFGGQASIIKRTHAIGLDAQPPLTSLWECTSHTLTINKVKSIDMLTTNFSASQSATNQRMRSLRRRIWWSLYVSLLLLEIKNRSLSLKIRNRHTSLAFGRPCRIRDERLWYQTSYRGRLHIWSRL